MIADYIVSHQAEFWLVFGFTMLVIEVVTGFTTGVFLFGGLGALSTGVLMSFGVLPETWIAGISCTGISSGIITMILWKPLNKLQGDRPIEKDNSSDLIGHEFVVETDIALNKPGVTDYSGIRWKVEIAKDAGVDSIAAGQTVIVSSVEVGLFKVKPNQ
ncbi:MAG: NfeD family protein [Gammaproteobacteria bacterium]|nr:NfeD family protein [Gammaproteobacteria bacterium]